MVIIVSHKTARQSRKPISQRLRFSVLERDEFACQYCGRRAPDVVLHVDHAISLADGGTDDFENLVAACWDCNLGKGARSIRSRSDVWPQREPRNPELLAQAHPPLQTSRAADDDPHQAWLSSLPLHRLVDYLNGRLQAPFEPTPPASYPW